MVKSVRALTKMVPTYRELEFYDETLGKGVPISKPALLEKLAGENPAKLYNTTDIPGEFLLIGHPDSGE